MSEIMSENMSENMLENMSIYIYLIIHFWFYNCFNMMSETFSPIIIQGAFVLPLTIFGIIEASAILSPSTPWTFN